MLDQGQISRALTGHPLGANLVFLDETGSTNDHAADLARAGHPDGTVVFAESQTSGRGRRGSTWEAPKSSSLLVSLLLRPPVPPQFYTRLTHIAALALGDSIDSLTGLKTTVKWPNDLYHEGKKLAGILVEASASGSGNHHAIVGIGLNVHTRPEQLHPDLVPIATSLHIASDGQPPSREQAAIELLRSFSTYYPAALSDHAFAACITTLRSRSHLIGHEVSAWIDGKKVVGTATDLGPEGELILTLADNSPLTLTNADIVRRTHDSL